MAAEQRSVIHFADEHFDKLRNAKCILHVAAIAADHKEMPPNGDDMYFTLMAARELIQQAEEAFNSYRKGQSPPTKPKLESV
jgi:hypothetical protein